MTIFGREISMDESTVFKAVANNLEERGYELLVHVPGSHSDTYRDVLNRYDEHRITIGGRYPDILGFTPTDQVYAIEVKGSSDILKGIGQALTYRRGAHSVFLAAAKHRIADIHDVVVGDGIGVLSVDEDTSIEWTAPAGAVNHDQLDDIKTRLSYQLRRPDITSAVSTVALTQPLNFLAPVLVLAQNNGPSRDELENRIEAEYQLSIPSYAVKGSEVLDFIRPGRQYSLTEQGELAKTVLNGVGISTLDQLESRKKSMRGSHVVDEIPAVATLLRNSYIRHPDFRLLLESLHSFPKSEIELPSYFQYLASSYPNVLLNIFCTDQKREYTRNLIETGNISRFSDRFVWEELLRSNIISNFVSQLKHMGVLSTETKGHHSKLSEYDLVKNHGYSVSNRGNM